MKVAILAKDLGKKLLEVTEIKSKPIAGIGGTPII